MLSVIICSKKPKLANQLKQNIESTIGVPFECIVIDNTTRNYSIFSAYNEGIRRSQYPYLCFVHEDVEFQTQNWGEKLSTHLSDPSVGMVGLCGTTYQTQLPTSWSLHEYTAYMIQSNKHRKLRIFEPSDGYDERHQKQVVTMDGMFLAARKDLFKDIAFDENTYKGFHVYDLDTCVQSHVHGLKNIAINDILLIHYSQGPRNKEWLNNILLFADKWKSHLPINVGNHSLEVIAQREAWYINIFLRKLVRFGYSDEDCKLFLQKYQPNHPSLDELVQSQQLKRELFTMRLKHNPLSLFIRPASRLS